MAPKILITNDDGIDAPGIKALAKILKPLGTVYTVAPSGERSAAAHSITFNHPLRVQHINKTSVAVDGTPTDCVMFGVYGLLNSKRPDLVVSGINNGPNLGDDITYSGTVSAALEGTLLKIPSIAISMGDRKNCKYMAGAEYIRYLCRKILKEGLPGNVFLNVNIPNVARSRIKGIIISKQGKRIYRDMFLKRLDPRGRSYYWLGGMEPSYEKENGTDFEAIERNMIAVTPLHYDLTDYPAMTLLKSLEKVKL
ncbi:MAG: 5'/3'-nucleotidase SurE [Candidatus Firestonebacteria bacterium]